MKVSTRLTLIWLLTAALMLLLAAAGILSSSAANLQARAASGLYELDVAIERGHGAAYAVAIGDPSGAAARRWQEARDLFRTHLQASVETAGPDGPEAASLRQLGEQFEAWSAAVESLPKTGGTLSVGRYWSEMEPMARQLSEQVGKLREGRKQAALSASQRAGDLVWRSRTWLATMAGLGVFFMLWMANHLQRNLVEPLRSMAEGSLALGTGEPHRRLHHPHDDELGRIARRVNDLADQLEVVRHKLRQHELLERNVTQALLQRFEEPCGLVDGAGALVASNDAFRRSIGPGADWLTELSARFELRRHPLADESGHPIGELLEIVRPGARGEPQLDIVVTPEG